MIAGQTLVCGKRTYFVVGLCKNMGSGIFEKKLE
jgi:hypothetical protein